jgi:hypothetical protein
MSRVVQKLVRYSVIAVSAAVVANGCMLDRRPISSPGQLVPAQYCPGDTLTASYDFLRTTVCTPRAGATGDCVTTAPTVTMTSNPALFPPTTLQSYQNSVMFPASGDRVDVNFAYGTTSVFIPPSVLLLVRDNTETARRIIGTIDQELIHPGTCSGANLPAEIPVGPPRLSPNLRLVELCNFNTVPVIVTLSGGPTGEMPPQTVDPGRCLDTSAPGMIGADAARIVSVRPMFVVGGPYMCTGTTADLISPTLRTVARMGCR